MENRPGRYHVDQPPPLMNFGQYIEAEVLSRIEAEFDQDFEAEVGKRFEVEF